MPSVAASPIRGSQRILPERISKSVFGPVVRQGDDQWFKIVQWTAYALIDAEEAGVTSLNVASLTAAKTHRIRRLLGLEGNYGPSLGLAPDFIAKTVITAVGNYGEIFDRNFGPDTGAGVARGQNSLWSNGGLIYAPNVDGRRRSRRGLSAGSRRSDLATRFSGICRRSHLGKMPC